MPNKNIRVAIISHALKVAGGLSVGVNILKQLTHVAPHIHFLISIPNLSEYEEIHYPPHTQLIRCNPNLSVINRLFFDFYLLPRQISSFRPDVIIGLGNVGLLNPPCTQAILFHKPQLIYPLIYQSQEIPLRKIHNKLLKVLLKLCLKKTLIVFCQTNAAKMRFRKEFNFRRPIYLCPNAVSSIVSDNVGSSISNEYDLSKAVKGKFVLFTLTRYYGHKNLERIVETFKRFKKELNDVVCLLTIHPNQHPNVNRLIEQIKCYDLESHIINIGPIDQQNIGFFYRLSDSLFMPTLLESFSGTYLEAMWFEKPILTSDLDFARDICGSAAMYFNPFSCQSICDAILQLKNNHQVQKQIIDSGRIQFERKALSWNQITSNMFRHLSII